MSNFTNEFQAFQIKPSVGASDWLVDVSGSSVKMQTIKVIASAGASVTPVFEVSTNNNVKLAVGAGGILVSAVSATSATALTNAWVQVSSALGILYIQCRTSAF